MLRWQQAEHTANGGTEMPKGKPNPQTIASEKYQKKAGYMTKGFKIKRDIADRFAKACDKVGVSQASQITKMMQGFINEVEGTSE